jgi:hypothetical protein
MYVTLPAPSLSRILASVTNISMSDPDVFVATTSSVRSQLSSMSRGTSVQLLNVLDRRMVIDLDIKLGGPKIKLPVRMGEDSKTFYGICFDFGEIKFFFFFFSL